MAVSQFEVLSIDPSPPDPYAERIVHTWGIDFYTITTEITCIVLVFLYSFVLYKVCRGSRYPFIIFLIVLFLISNLSEAIMAYFLYEASIVV